DGVALNNAGVRSFTTGSDSDSTNPAITGGTNYPTGTDIPLVAPVISIVFTETGEIDLSTINSSTFYLERDSDGLRIPANYSYNISSNNATLTPTVNLEVNTLYEVWVTTGIKDLSGNSLSAGTNWTFTTTATDLDPVGGDPNIIDGPNVDYVSDTTAIVSWITNEPTDHSLNFGASDGFGSSDINSSYYSIHSVTLTGLNPGQRYWFEVEYSDIVGIPGITSTTDQFNTTTTESPDDIANLSGSNPLHQNNLYSIPQKKTVPSSGAFMFWTDNNSGNYHLYGQLFDNSLAKLWNGTAPNAIFTEGGQNFIYQSSVEDEVGGVIIFASLGGAGIYAKRLDSGGNIINWGVDSDEATDRGFQINAIGSEISAIPVYTGILSSITSGTTEMESENLNFPFFDHDALLNVLIDGDIIYDPVNNEGTRIENNSSQDFFYIVGQDANIIGPGDTYRIGDSSTNSTFTAEDHLMNNSTAYSNGGSVIYTEHGYTRPGWMDAGDIVFDGTNYGVITNIELINSTGGSIDTGSAQEDQANRLWVSDFISAGVTVGDMVVEITGTYEYAVVLAVTATELTLDNDIFPGGNEDYEIYGINQTISTGTATDQNSLELIDNSTDFTAFPLLDTNDFVKDTNETFYASITGIGNDTLDIDKDIFSTSDNYEVLNNIGLVTSGTANGAVVDTLIYDPQGWTGIVSAGDLVVETGTNAYATVSSVISDTELQLSDDIFPNGNETFAIYDDFCTTHWDSEPLTTFYRITVDWGMGVSDTDTITIYDYTGTNGTADTPPTNRLYDNDANFPGSGVLNGDIVINYTDLSNPIDPNLAVIDNTTYTTHNRALDMDTDIFSDNENYNIIRFNTALTDKNDIIDTGLATGTSAGHLVDSGNNFTVAPIVNVGDVVYNITDSEYAMVTNVTANDLTLSKDASFDNTDRYIIIRKRGILYVWQESGSVMGKILTIDGAPPLELVAQFTIQANSVLPKAIPDGNGNALVVYRTTTGDDIFAELVDGSGQTQWTTEIDTQTANNEAIIDVQSDENGGLVVLYRHGTDIHAQRINNSGTRLWGINGRSLDNDGGTTNTSEEKMVYDPISDDIIVVAKVNNNIWAIRAGTTSWGPIGITSLGTSIQKDPSIYYDGTDAIIIWQDDRFTSGVGYGIFGMKIDASTGAKDVLWRANTGGTNDENGVTIMLNYYNDDWINPQIISHSNGSEAILVWEDWRTGGLPYQGADLVYMDNLRTFVP
ncbi:Ig-like domain-containing protein, partial [Spirochaetota bacterium]